MTSQSAQNPAKKIFFLLAALLALASLAAGAARAATINLAPASKLEIDIPDNWKSTVSEGDSGSGISYAVEFTMPEELHLSCTMTLIHSDEMDFPTQEQSRQRLRTTGDAFIGGSLEKQVNVKDLEVKDGVGSYYTMTDASLVGKTPKPGDYKTMTAFLIHYRDHTAALVTVFADDTNGPAFRQMFKALAGMKPALVAPPAGAKPAGAAKVELKKNEKGMLIGRAASRTQLLIPSAAYAEGSRAGGRGDPGYFMGRDDKNGIIVSGWFEPAERFRYGTAKKLWDSEGLTKAPNAEMVKVNGWEVIAYEMSSMPKICDAHLRANLVTGDTWIDLHLSLMDEKSCGALRQQLLAYLKAMQITAAPGGK